MTTCYLHIGTEKTGTSSIQEFLYHNCESLKTQGIWYSSTLGRVTHRKIAVYAQESELRDEGFRLFGLESVEDHLAFRKQVEADLEEEIRAFSKAKCHTFIISSEHCHSRLTTNDMVYRVWQLLVPYFDRIEVVCFLRPQIDVAVSLASTAARVGKTVDMDFFNIRPNSKYYDYRSLLKRWSNGFGKANLCVVPYKKNNDVIKYFIQKLHIQGNDVQEIEAVNTAFDISTMALMKLAVSRSQNGLHSILRKLLENAPLRQRLLIPRETAVAVQSKFSPSNAWICSNFPEIEDNDLIPDWSTFDERGNLELLDIPEYLHENLLLILSELERKMNDKEELRSRIRALNERLSLTRSELSGAKGHIAKLEPKLTHLKKIGEEKEVAHIEQIQQRLSLERELNAEKIALVTKDYEERIIAMEKASESRLRELTASYEQNLQLVEKAWQGRLKDQAALHDLAILSLTKMYEEKIRQQSREHEERIQELLNRHVVALKAAQDDLAAKIKKLAEYRKLYYQTPLIAYRKLPARFLLFLDRFLGQDKVPERYLLNRLVFDPIYYAQANPQIRDNIKNDPRLAAEHWVKKGAAAGLPAAATFHVKYYLHKHPDLAKRFRRNYPAAIQHWIDFGIDEGRSSSPEFDVQAYQSRYADLQMAFGGNFGKVVTHWLVHGIHEGRIATP